MTSALLPVFQPAPMIFEHGEGAWLTATDGERYLDFGAGIAVNALTNAYSGGFGVSLLGATLSTAAVILWIGTRRQPAD